MSLTTFTRVNMKKALSILSIITITAVSALFLTNDAESYQSGSFFASTAGMFAKTFRTVKNNAYTYGERLDYEVNYSFITAGKGYFYIYPKPEHVNGRECYDIRFEVRSLKSLEMLYKVQDTYRTILDAKGIFPWSFEQHVREGGYKRDFKANFDQNNNFATVGSKKFKTPDYVHDIVSAFYYVRTMDLGSMKKGTVFTLNNFFDNKTYKLGVKIHGKRTIEVSAGKFRCIAIEPLVVDGGLFKSEGSILIYVTDDDLKIPVKVETKIVIGSVSADLVKYSGLKSSIKAKL